MTKGFVRQQALKEKGEKRVRLFFLLLCCQGQQCLPPSPSLPDVCVLLKQELEGGGNSCQNIWGLPFPGPHVGWVGHFVPPWPLSLALLWGPQHSQKFTARKPQLLAPGFLMRISPGGLQ